MSQNDSLFERYSSSWTSDSVRLFSTPSAATRQSLMYVQEVGYFNTYPPYFTERAHLSSYLIVHTLSGHGRLTYKNTTYDLSAGQTFMLDCQTFHHYECAADTAWEILWLHFNGLSAAGYYRMFNDYAAPVVHSSEGSSAIEQNLLRILSLTKHKDVHSELICANLIGNTLTEMIINNSVKTLELTPMPAYIRTAVDHINKQYSQAISLDYLAKLTNVSKYYLSHEFTKHMGKSIQAYLSEQRLNHAKELLLYSGETVNEIAYACGFNHVSHFINLFKRNEGLTPLAYRKEWQVG